MPEYKADSANHEASRDHNAVQPVIRPETTPLYTTSVYTFPSLEDVRGYYTGSDPSYLYRRNGNPNTRQLEDIISKLEHTQASVLASSGMAAISAACFALLKPGDSILATEVLYGGTYAFFEQVLRPWGVLIHYVDVNDPTALSTMLTSTTRMVYAETIANPLLQVADLTQLGDFARENGLFLMVDNTFATPALIRPVEHGVTLVVNSLTKYMNGHSDVIGGVCSGSAELVDRIRRFSETFGSVLSPFDAWMTERGLHTFNLRVRQQCENARLLANSLQKHDMVNAVYYPGLPSHKTHTVAKRILSGGYGAIVSFEIKGGEAAADAFVRACQMVEFAPSLGGVKTTLSHPALTSHRAFSAEERERLGITDGVIRVSVGIEPFADIWGDVEQALRAISQ